jgi:hypothetical protein
MLSCSYLLLLMQMFLLLGFPTARVVVVDVICGLCFLYIAGTLCYLLAGCFLVLMLVCLSWAPLIWLSTFCSLVGSVLVVRHRLLLFRREPYCCLLECVQLFLLPSAAMSM